jgi:DNA-binding PadR family transcriptional regulator
MPTIDFNNLDTAIHGQTRLGIISALCLNGTLDFTELKKRLSTTDGSLGAHLKKLEELEYIFADKRFVDKRPKTTYSITDKGKSAFKKYLESMQFLIDKIRISEQLN